MGMNHPGEEPGSFLKGHPLLWVCICSFAEKQTLQGPGPWAVTLVVAPSQHSALHTCASGTNDAVCASVVLHAGREGINEVLVGGDFTAFRCFGKRHRPAAEVTIVDTEERSTTTASRGAGAAESDEDWSSSLHC